MGFYIRKSVSAGPFRFNLSSSGVGLSVGVRGFRVGTGPRGNYVHMGRGGFYYRGSLGGHGRTATYPPAPVEPSAAVYSGSVIETGNVLEMKPSNGSQILEQINEKLALYPLWPWPLVVGAALGLLNFTQPNGSFLGATILAIAAALSALLAFYDAQRKTVVIMYDLEDDVLAPFRAFAEEFEKLQSAARIWNIDSAEHTTDWKRNAGAGRLITRKLARLTYETASVIKTNVSIPAILGGRQNIYFFPDVVLVVHGARAGALSYDQLNVDWTNTVFVEEERVPADARIVGHTWRYVNKKGGPDRRFNNNRQIPQALYLQMELGSHEGLRKVLHFSRLMDNAGFDGALDGLRRMIRQLKRVDPEPAA